MGNTPNSFNESNQNHNPSMCPQNLCMRPGWLAIQFPQMPTQEEGRAGIVLPGRKQRDPGKARAGMIDADHPPNCARVWAAGEDCAAKPGDYVFFHQRVEDGREAHYIKPQPLIPVWDPMDRFPALWALKDAHVISQTTHAGDAEEVEFEGTVEVLGLSGKWHPTGGDHIVTGERFRTFDADGLVIGVYIALGRSVELVEDVRWVVTAARYDGPEAGDLGSGDRV